MLLLIQHKKNAKKYSIFGGFFIFFTDAFMYQTSEVVKKKKRKRKDKKKGKIWWQYGLNKVKFATSVFPNQKSNRKRKYKFTKKFPLKPTFSCFSFIFFNLFECT